MGGCESWKTMTFLICTKLCLVTAAAPRINITEMVSGIYRIPQERSLLQSKGKEPLGQGETIE